MKARSARALCGLGLCLLLGTLQARPLPPELGPAVPGAGLSGQALLRVWGLEIYEATLWVAPGFDAAAYEAQPFALELSYRRAFTGADIAERSLAEMGRQATPTPQQASAWATQLRTLFPDVQRGDRITGLHRPGSGARFWHNGRLLGELSDPVLAARFFGIWLSPQTSEPQLRRALLAQARSLTAGSAAP